MKETIHLIGGPVAGESREVNAGIDYFVQPIRSKACKWKQALYVRDVKQPSKFRYERTESNT